MEVFGPAQAHHDYLLANARGTRMKLLVHDGFDVWCATRSLTRGRFVWPGDGPQLQAPTLSRAQLDALIVGLLEPIRYIPPAEAEANYYRQLASQATTVAA